MSIKGIDVYTGNGNIDWNKVKASGVEFAMIKASQGRGEGLTTKHLRAFEDGRFERNIKGACDAGIACGVYHYFTAQTMAEADFEADFFLATIAPYRHMIKLWAAVDVESEMYFKGLSRAQITAVTRQFMDTVRASGLNPMLYTNPNYLVYRFEPDSMADADIWLAHYVTGKHADVPGVKIWQYGSSGTAADVKKGYATIADGRIPGINAACDVNIGYFELPKNACKPKYKIGDKYTIKAGDKYKYSDGSEKPIPKTLAGKEYTIANVKADRILLSEIVSWVAV